VKIWPISTCIISDLIFKPITNNPIKYYRQSNQISPTIQSNITDNPIKYHRQSNQISPTMQIYSSPSPPPLSAPTYNTPYPANSSPPPPSHSSEHPQSQISRLCLQSNMIGYDSDRILFSHLLIILMEIVVDRILDLYRLIWLMLGVDLNRRGGNIGCLSLCIFGCRMCCLC